MAIRTQQVESGTAAAKSGAQLGKAQREKENIDRKAQQDAHKASLDWEVQKAAMRSQQEFAQELQDKQFRYDMFNASKAWDIEKMQTASRIDFEREERVRQQKLDGIDKAEAQLDKEVESGREDEDSEQIKALRSHYQQQRIAIEYGVRPAPYLRERTNQSKLSLLSGGEDIANDIANPLGFNMDTPSGTIIKPASKEQLQLEAEQKFRVISPDGDEEIIDAADWADYKTRGYILADIVKLRGQRVLDEMAKISGLGGL